MLDTGIYQIRNTANGKLYVGSAVNFGKRWQVHLSQLRRGQHHTVGLQRAWNKYGESRFAFEPLLICAKDMLLFYEQRAIDGLRPRYNSARVAGSTLGVKHSATAKANNAAARRGKKLSAEHCAKLSEKLRGRPVSAKAMAVLTGNKGRKHSAETVEKNRRAHLGYKHTQAAKDKVAAAVKGRVVSDETRAKLSAAAKARTPPPQSAETRAKRSTALVLAWQRRKEGVL